MNSFYIYAMRFTSYLLLSFLLFSCNGSETPDGTRFTTSVGETFSIEMKSNVTTGYQWFMVRRPSLADSVAQKYRGDFGAGCSNGAGGMEKWEFKAIKKGIDTIGFVYARDLSNEEYSQYRQRVYVVEVE